jgi:2,4-dienoyl-CoA reductase (NADPH2)
MNLLNPLSLGPCQLNGRVMFGPHVTNLGDDERRFTPRHTAYYARRAAGGCSVIVTEGASVHDSDWPYERAPLARRCAAGWREIAAACHQHGTVVIASLDHAGGQGSSAYSQLPLWAPSRVPEVNTRESPKWMEASDIGAVITGFASAAEVAIGAGCDGVEINAGQHSLVRQFLSGLTNHRTDQWGEDRLAFARQVIGAVRPHTPLLGLRLCCDELAPWAGITPEMAPTMAAALADAGIDYVVVTRGSIYSAEQTRPDFHQPPGFNIDVCRAVKAVLPHTPVFLQGSVVDSDQRHAGDRASLTAEAIFDLDLTGSYRTQQRASFDGHAALGEANVGGRQVAAGRQLVAGDVILRDQHRPLAQFLGEGDGDRAADRVEQDDPAVR